ncbi:MAG: Glu-tRNA(Gln) amidotransferase subunit GatD [Candidatus Latescibacteria bacterium]|nr:Glu-tRNA(Gln) amidotransferase subunit GatD [Candidatus Latescibacterota bacterium]
MIDPERSEEQKGYKGLALALLQRFSVRVWDDLEVETEDGLYEGILLPRSETADDLHVVLKIANGYNIGLRASSVKEIRVRGRREARYRIPEKEFPVDPEKPNLVLLGTGGTIASRLDYRSGAVIPAFEPGELYGAVPELADYCNLRTRKLYGVFSENIAPEHWIGTAKAIAEEIEQGVDGILIGHGTDVMHFTAAALSFMVQDPPVPIILVGSQRSSDRPSSDAALNLIHSAKAAAECDIAEVMVCMFGPTSHSYGLLHQGTRVRKMHSSHRSTFRTIGEIPLATVSRTEIRPLRHDYRRRDPDRKPRIDTSFEEKVCLLAYYPNMQPDVIDALVEAGYRGIVLAGTGLGHVNKPLFAALRRAIQDRGVAVYMTVQTLWGYAQMYVYDTGRDLMSLGVVPAANMIPETAYVKLGWALGRTDDLEEVRRIMLTPVARETTPREPHNGYLVLQGGIPEVENLLSRIPR